jgi:uncharacterized protein YwgA
MNRRESWWQRLALITALVEHAPNRTLGRTAIVKMAYLLQVLRGVPLGYDFRLYIYGPFDPEVLGDLEYAQALKAVEVQTVLYPGGYRYDVRPGPLAKAVQAQASDWLAQHREAIGWVVQEFGDCMASELELLSTIVYADRELAQGQQNVTAEELARRVHEVKPHFSKNVVSQKTNSLLDRGMLRSVTRVTGSA